MDSVYGLNGLDGNGYNSYGFDSGRSGANPTSTSGSTALYHHNGSRYGLGLPARTNSGAGDGKMNGLHGPKHKRGDMDRECKAQRFFPVVARADVFRSQPICRDSPRRLARRDSRAVQGPTWLSVLAEEIGRGLCGA